MGTPRAKLISDLYQAAAARSPEERSAFLNEACKGDRSLQQEIESLLCSDAAQFSETPSVELVAKAVAERANLVGRQLGPYQIVALLGAGGMGEVYRA